MGSRPTLIFDTSGINCLADDADSAALIAGLQSGFHVRLTFTSICEIIANTNGVRRQVLLAVCKRLLLLELDANGTASGGLEGTEGTRNSV